MKTTKILAYLLLISHSIIGVSLVDLSLAQIVTAEISFPYVLSEENTSINFEVDSTWHLVEGTSKVVRGKVWLKKPTDLNSIQGEIHFPVNSFDTDGESRDERLREVMAEQQYPDVVYWLDRILPNCSLNNLGVGKSCLNVIEGRLKIREFVKRLTIPVEISRSELKYTMKGRTTLSWKEFGVKDPSIFIAHLNENISITFECNLSKNEDTAKKDARK